MFGPWHTDAQTNMFFSGENSYWKNDLWEWLTEIKKCETTKNEKVQKYTRTFIYQNI